MSHSNISILGCGWYGLPLGHELVNNGYHVRGSTTSETKISQLHGAGIEPYKIELAPEVRCPSCEKFWQSDILVLNIPPGRKQENAAELFMAKIQALIRYLKAVQHRINWIIFVSSTSVYTNRKGVMQEDDAEITSHLSDSGRALLEAEMALESRGNWDTTVLRFGGLYGYDRHPVKYLAGRKKLSRGNAPVNLVHRDDCINVTLEAIKQNARNETYNVVSDGHPPRSTFYISAAEHFGLEPPDFLEDESQNYKIVSNRKMKEDLGYELLYPNPMDHTP